MYIYIFLTNCFKVKSTKYIKYSFCYVHGVYGWLGMQCHFMENALFHTTVKFNICIFFKASMDLGHISELREIKEE